MKIKKDKIRNARMEKNYSQEYLAELLGISQAQYNRLENGRHNFDIDKLGKIFDILEINPLEVLEFSEKQQVFINTRNSIGTNFGDIKGSLNDVDFIREIIKEEINKKK